MKTSIILLVVILAQAGVIFSQSHRLKQCRESADAMLASSQEVRNVADKATTSMFKALDKTQEDYITAVTACHETVELQKAIIAKLEKRLENLVHGKTAEARPYYYHHPVLWSTNGDWLMASGWDDANKCHARWSRYTGTNTSGFLFSWERLD